MVNALIALVLTLIVQVQSPNVPLETKVQALQLAQKILVLAQQEQQASPISQGPATLPVSTPVASEPIQTPTQPTAGTPAPTVPVCALSATLSPLSNGRAQVYFGWDMDPNATGMLSGYGTLPSYTSHVTHPPIVSVIQGQQVVTYTLTETMNDPSYQTTTTCQVTADTSDL